MALTSSRSTTVRTWSRVSRAGADHLRGAAQRVGVLHPAVMALVRPHDAGAGQDHQHVRRGRGLTGVRPEGGQFRPERLVGPEQCFDRHGRGHLGAAQQPAAVLAGQAEMAEHPVRAVGQGQALFGFEGDRRQTGGAEGVGRGCWPARPVDHLPLTHQGQGHVRQRSQIAAATERAVFADDRRDSGVEQADQTVDQLRSNPGISLGQGGGPQEHHGPDRLRFNLVAHGGGVGADQTDLQGGPLPGGDVPLGQGAKAGRQPVHGLFPADQRGGDGIGPLAARPPPRRSRRRAAGLGPRPPPRRQRRPSRPRSTSASRSSAAWSWRAVGGRALNAKPPERGSRERDVPRPYRL